MSFPSNVLTLCGIFLHMLVISNGTTFSMPSMDTREILFWLKVCTGGAVPIDCCCCYCCCIGSSCWGWCTVGPPVFAPSEARWPEVRMVTGSEALITAVTS